MKAAVATGIPGGKSPGTAGATSTVSGASRTLETMRMGKRLYSLVMFFVVAVLGGLLAAGMLIPMAGMAAETGKGAAESLAVLPTELETPPQAERSRLLNSDGTILAYFYDENRIYEELDNIAPIMQQAQIAIEDHRFYEHGAIDLQGTLRALVSTTQGNTQGGSSLTQQYVRLVQVEAASAKNDQLAVARATENTLARKIRELRFAIAMEKKFSKDEILERYLNIAYYGDGAYGVEAAARHYFGTSAKKLTLPQAAMLAGLVRNPVATNPVAHPLVAIERRNNVLDRMAELGVVTAEEAADAKAEPFDKSKVRESRLGCANSRYPFICDYAYRTLLQTKSLGATPEERKDLVYRGGLTIQTQIDPKAQTKAEKTIHAYLDPRDPVVSVMVMMEPGTGLIVAMAQNRTKMGTKRGETFFNYAVKNSMGGSDGYQGGSTFKAFVAAAALERGMGAYGTINARAHMNFKGKVFRSCSGNITVRDDWNVDNASPSGRMNLFQGTKNSVNTYFVQLEQAVGLCAVTKMAKRLGLEISMPGRDLVEEYNEIPSFTLGAVEVTPLSMIEAYGTFAARGIHCEPIILKSIKTKDGTSLPVPSAGCKRVLSEEVADAVNKIFQGPFNGGTATLAKVPGYEMAGKTGTVPRNKAIWTVGYTPELVGAGMISYDNHKQFRKFWRSKSSFLRYARMPYSGRFLTGASGSEAGARIFKPAFAAALKGRPNTRFVEPPASILQGRTVPVPSCSGMGVASCQALLREAGFTTYTTYIASDRPKGTFLGVTPSGSAPKFSQIGLLLSQGPKKKKSSEETSQPAPAPAPTKTTKPGRRP